MAVQDVARKSNTCLCGCGKAAKKQFIQGHDAKLHSKVVAAAEDEKKLPAALVKLAGKYIKDRWPAHAKIVL